MPEYERVCQSMQEYARVCQSMPEYARVCQSMQIVTDQKVEAPRPTFEPPKKKTKRTVTEHPSLRLKQIVNQVPLPHTVVTTNIDESINWQTSQDKLEEICTRPLDQV